MAIIVGDIHGNLEKVKAFLAYKPDHEHVALGDYLDSFHEPIERQLECIKLLMDSSAVLLWGNHDLHYLRVPLFQYPGFQAEHAEMLQTLLEENIGRFCPAHVADGWLCTHAGVHSGITAKNDDVVALAEMFNGCWQEYLKDRDKGYRYKSIFKFDFMVEGSLAPTNILQVYGHDELSPAEFVNESCVSLASNDRAIVSLFDTESVQIILLPLRPDLKPKNGGVGFPEGGCK
jgi:Calcineurin-like phosphoesterase